MGRPLAYQLLLLEEEAVGQADCPFLVKIKGDKEVGRQRSTHLMGHLSGILAKGGGKTMGNHFKVNNAIWRMCQLKNIEDGNRNVNT